MRAHASVDREILVLALPALGALAAEPLYVLVDTAIVGHLGTTPLAALAIAATVLSSAFTVFNFLTYGTTARVARLHGAGRGAAGPAAPPPRRAVRCAPVWGVSALLPSRWRSSSRRWPRPRSR